MEYKASYSFSFKPEKEAETLYFDFVNCGAYTFDVLGADGLDPEGEAGGSFSFSCEIDGEPEEIDWETFDEDLVNLEAVFSLEDGNGEPVGFNDDAEFMLTIYDDNGNKREGTTKTVMYGNM